jgi:hypothetical protein
MSPSKVARSTRSHLISGGVRVVTLSGHEAYDTNVKRTGKAGFLRPRTISGRFWPFLERFGPTAY